MGSLGVFVDWLSVSQYHGSGTPELVGGLRFQLDDDGSPSVECGSARRIEGSYSSSCLVTSHGGWVRFSGNPSRFDRPDNLFGFELDYSMDRVNRVMRSLGLPEFTRGDPVVSSAKCAGDVERLVWTGAAFSRVDLACNWAAGSDLLAKLAMRSYSRRVASYMRKSVYGDETVMWSNTRRTVKAYRKGPDMQVHAKGSPWIEWVLSAGIVRHEVSLKRRVLSDSGLRYWGNVDMGKLVQLFDKETEVFRRPDASLDPLAIEACPRASRVVYAAWLRGEDVRALLPRRSFFRHRKVLRELASVDIAEVRPTGAEVVPLVREVVLRPAVPPAGYWDFDKVAA